MPPRVQAVLKLGTAQTLAWASSFYLPAMLAAPMARDLGVGTPAVYALLSMALIVSAFLGPWAGRRIDHLGGRPVLMASSGVFAAGLLLLAVAQNLAMGVAAWLLLGLAMGCGLYDAAFAALVRLYGRDARRSISGITLIAGFASTVGWPLTAYMESHLGWRGACVVWAALHLLVGLPLNAWLPRAAVGEGAAQPAQLPASPPASPPDAPAAAVQTQAPQAEAPQAHAAVLLALMFALLSFVSTSVATHLPALLQAGGATLAGAVAVGALVGPSQVAARLFELGLLRRVSPLFTARAAALGHPVGAVLLLALGPVVVVPFVVLHGLGNGLLTIVRGTLPLALFGNAGYGARQGWLTLPARVLGALSPWLFGLVLDRFGSASLWLTGALALMACGVLQVLRLPHDTQGTH